MAVKVARAIAFQLARNRSNSRPSHSFPQTAMPGESLSLSPGIRGLESLSFNFLSSSAAWIAA
jgi:hypothetical protein